MEFEIIKSNWDKNSLESKIIFKNNTDKNLRFVTIDAKFYDKDENIVDVDDTIFDGIPPHSEKVVILNFYNLDVDNIESYTLEISRIL